MKAPGLRLEPRPKQNRADGEPQRGFKLIEDDFDVQADLLDDAGLFEHLVGTILGHGLQGLRAETDFHELAELRNPDALVEQVRVDLALHTLGDVLTDTAFFLGFTAAMGFVAGGYLDA